VGLDAGDSSRSDDLTGLRNRREFNDVLRAEVARAHREGRRLSLVLLDLDKFKRVNDTLGHPKGDTVLIKFADRMREVTRAADVACRTGGEEFAVVLPGSSLDDATQFAALLDSRIAAQPILEAWDVTVSSGVVELSDGEDADRLLARADLALYEKKRGQPPPPGTSGVREPRRPKPSGESPGTWVQLDETSSAAASETD
jgi:diguanylate cyclase (GGDEF)-like protein